MRACTYNYRCRQCGRRTTIVENVILTVNQRQLIERRLCKKCTHRNEQRLLFALDKKGGPYDHRA